MSQNSGMKMTIKIGQEEIKEAIKQYMKLRLGPTLKISPSLEVEFIIHNSYSDIFQAFLCREQLSDEHLFQKPFQDRFQL